MWTKGVFHIPNLSNARPGTGADFVKLFHCKTVYDAESLVVEDGIPLRGSCGFGEDVDGCDADFGANVTTRVDGVVV